MEWKEVLQENRMIFSYDVPKIMPAYKNRFGMVKLDCPYKNKSNLPYSNYIREFADMVLLSKGGGFITINTQRKCQVLYPNLRLPTTQRLSSGCSVSCIRS